MEHRHSERNEDFLAANWMFEAGRLAAEGGTLRLSDSSSPSPDSSAREGNSSAAVAWSLSGLLLLMLAPLPLKCSSLTWIATFLPL